MDDIGFPKNMPNEHMSFVYAAFNEIKRLKDEVNYYRRKLYGSKAERYICEKIEIPQNSLFDEPENIIASQTNTEEENIDSNEEVSSFQEKETKDDKKQKNEKTSRKPGGKKPFPENLPREDKVHDIPEDKKVCHCGCSKLIRIGEESVEKIDVVPASFKVVNHIYPKYACPECEQNVVKAHAAPSLIPGSMAESGLLAHIVTHKYLFALPLYRQENMLQQKNIFIPRITLARWVIACAQAVEPLVEEIKKYILSLPVVHCDETPVQVLKGTGKAPTSKSYMWVIASGLNARPAVVFQYYSSRKSECAFDLLTDFKGECIQVDGYSGYDALCTQKNLKRAGCFAHVRRKFHEAFQDGSKSGKPLAEKFLQKIQDLFMIERDLVPLSPDKRKDERQNKSKFIMNEIRTLIDENVTKIVPGNKLGSAFGYISNEWPYLQEFLTNGLISISNNTVENSIRPFALGRKNWLFADTSQGAHASAILYSLVSSAKENKIPVEDYLTHVFTKLPLVGKEEGLTLESLLPWNYVMPPEVEGQE